jgi:SAM-dependent methyltransferase
MTTSGFKDFFSAKATEYATFRPTYPDALFEFIASLPAARGTVWDCATGNGQAAIPLAKRFDRVIATDASREQIRQATAHPRVSYGVALADASGLSDDSVDLVTVAQALHWLPLDGFVAEVRRVIAPGGALAVWCYTVPRLGGVIDEIVDDYYSGTCGPYWAPERRLVDQGYATLAMPFDDVAAPPLHIESRVTLDAFAGYLRTWSATQKLAAEIGRDPVIEVQDALRRRWGRDTDTWLARWPIHMRGGRVTQLA